MLCEKLERGHIKRKKSGHQLDNTKCCPINISPFFNLRKQMRNSQMF